ncbi:MAG: BREX-1 system phosphatase PglZ type A [Oscillospiraceae bacterium]|nr:BREX-1 system phosphatase PglZ type A [Oscillospiraceae bacterium]
MPTLDLKQITDKLNAEFAGDTRKIVFWYDNEAEFTDDIDSLPIVGAKLQKLTQFNQFSTKYLLERDDNESSYLIYAPFPKPDVLNNALEDTLLYSRQFHADRISLLASDLRIDESLKPVLQKYKGFFDKKGAKARTQRFYDFEIENYSKEIIETALMSALCKTRVSFDEVLRVVLTDGGHINNPYLEDFEKYELLPVFWQMCEESLGYTDNTPNLFRLVATLLITYTARQLQDDVPKAWREFVSYKSGSIIAFLENLMNSIIYREQYDELANEAANVLNVMDIFSDAAPDTIQDCDAFNTFDEIIIKWITGRLMDKDIGATSGGLGLSTLCELRKKKHFGAQYKYHYTMLSAAYEIIRQNAYTCPDQFVDIVKRYVTTDYKIDRHYRDFYSAYDMLTDAEAFEDLRILVENIYTNDYLNRLLTAWNKALDIKTVMKEETSQLCFFNWWVRSAKEKTAVIISDAFRYEVGRELFERLNDDSKCTVEMGHLIGVLPSYTQLGMAALLPHKVLEIKSDGTVLVDGQASDGTDKREAILQAALPDSCCVNAETLPKGKPLRDICNGKDAIYIYHNHIDKRGSSSEKDVFAACSEAVEEIYSLIRRLTGANVVRYIITADHGFLYKYDRFNESEKINLAGKKDIYANRRFIISDSPIEADGVVSAPLSDIIGGEDERFVSWPVSANVFKTQGGLNFVHGGSSPQEMILPIITVRTEKGYVETRQSKIALVSMAAKITNLITHLDFIQPEPVSDIITPAVYRLYFISDENEKISNEQMYHADKKDIDPNKRMLRLKFSFKNKKYDNARQYWLVVLRNESTKKDEKDIWIEQFRHQVIMDIAFADDFGFDV